MAKWTKSKIKGLPGGTGDKNSPANEKYGSNLCSGKIPCAMEQLSLCTTTTEPVFFRPQATATELPDINQFVSIHLEPVTSTRGAFTAMRSPCSTTRNTPALHN